jgi:hypothetical protein
MDAVERNQTWELADLPAGHHAITLKWVYKLKKDEAEVVIKHKARLVARGFVQQEGVDFDNAFCPSCRWSLFVSSRWQPRRDGMCTTWTSTPPSSTVT